MPCCKSKLAFKPPPKSSEPFRPQREPFTPPLCMRVWVVPASNFATLAEGRVTPVPLSNLALPTQRSTRPYKVTEDWAIAAPEAAKTANAIYDFFISKFSKVKQRAPEQKGFKTPGQPPVSGS